MQTAIQLILVATVLLITATVVIFMFQGESQVVPEFSDSQVSAKQCQLWKQENPGKLCQNKDKCSSYVEMPSSC